MEFTRPVEAIISGIPGRVLGALARVDSELSLRDVARVSSSSPAQTSRVLQRFVDLGLVVRRDVPPAALFRLVPDNLVTEMIRDLSTLRARVTAKMRRDAAHIQPAPTALVLYGSFVRGHAGMDSDIDVLVVRPDAVSAENADWESSLEDWRRAAAAAAGNSVEILEVGTSELRELLANPEGVWLAIASDGVAILGPSIGAFVAHPTH